MRGRVLWFLGLLALVGADKPQDDEIKMELDRLQGTWKVESAEVGGMIMPKKAFQKVTIFFNADEITFRDGNTVYDRVTFDPDLSTKPKSADLRHTTGLKKGLQERAIYELKGDQLKLCIGEARKKRPTVFASAEGTGQQLFILKRQKAVGEK